MSDNNEKVTLERPSVKSDKKWESEIELAKEQVKPIEVKPDAVVDKKDLTDFIAINNGTVEEFLDIYKKIADDIDSFKEQLEDSDSYLFKLVKSSKNQSTQFELMREALERLNESNKNLSRSNDALRDKVTSGKKVGGGEVTGKDGRMSVIARTRGLKKIMLYNSCFHVMIRPFDLAELNEIFNTVDNDSKEFGRMIGGHFHLISDVFIKQKFMELFPKCVVSSNLKDYKKKGVLEEAISFQDYDVLLWGCCSLLFKEGVNIELVCVNPECKHVESNLFIDLNETRLNNFDLIPEDVLTAMIKGNDVSLKELKVLQKSLNFNKKIIVGDEVYHVKVPSMAEYLNNGLSLIAKIIAAVNGQTSVDDERMQAQIVIYLYQTQLPWIEKIDFIGDNGELDFFTKDKDAIMEALDVNRHEKENFYNELKNFVIDTKLTYICYSAVKCPVCQKTPTNSLKDYFPVDVQMLFFYLSCRLLLLAGLNLNRI